MGKIKSFTIQIDSEIVSQTYPELTEAQISAVMKELKEYEADVFDFIFERIEEIVEDKIDEDEDEDEDEEESDEPWMNDLDDDDVDDDDDDDDEDDDDDDE
jgi:hypothetical protein